MEKKKHKNDITIETIVKNTISMCITGCLVGRYNDSKNSRPSAEYTFGSVITYLENYANDYTVDLFLDNFNFLMRNIFQYTTKEYLNDNDQTVAVNKVVGKLVSEDPHWMGLLTSILPENIEIDFDSIKALDEVDYSEDEIIEFINDDLLSNIDHTDTDTKVIYKDGEFTISGGIIDMDNLPTDMPESLQSLLKSIAGTKNTPSINNEIKEVGDTVYISDIINTLYLVNEDGEQVWKKGQPLKDTENSRLVNKKAVVILKNQTTHYKCTNCNYNHTADLMIYYPHINSKYYINSIYVELLSETTI